MVSLTLGIACFQKRIWRGSERRVAVADIQNYATGGVDILMFDSHSALPRIVLQVSCQLRVLLTPHPCRCKLGKRGRARPCGGSGLRPALPHLAEPDAQCRSGAGKPCLRRSGPRPGPCVASGRRRNLRPFFTSPTFRPCSRPLPLAPVIPSVHLHNCSTSPSYTGDAAVDSGRY
jgi:hypothetical protein